MLIVATVSFLRFVAFKKIGYGCTIHFTLLSVWGQKTYDPAHFPLGPRALAEECSCRGQVAKDRMA